MKIDDLIFSIGDHRLPLRPRTKALLQAHRQLVLDDINRLQGVLSSTQAIGLKDRLKIRSLVDLARALENKNEIIPSPVRLLFPLGPPAVTKRHLAEARRLLPPYLDHLCSQLYNNNHLAQSQFDTLFDPDTGGNRRDIDYILMDMGAWKIEPDYYFETLLVWGNMPREEFQFSLASKHQILSKYVEYTEEKRIFRELREDNLECPDTDDFLDDYRFGLQLSLFCGGGHAGMYLEMDKRYYVVTAAHRLFPELTAMPLHSEELSTFNDLVPFAIYNDEFDIAIVPCLKSFHPDDSNSFGLPNLANPHVWDTSFEDVNLQILKEGETGEWTVGSVVAASVTFGGYRNMVKVQASKYGRVRVFGDSADSMYYGTIGIMGWPIPIHRTSDDEEGVGYGCRFLPAFEAVLKKLGIPDRNDFRVPERRPLYFPS
ncbi:hypothetical protein DFS34DRAFT_674788 [Phlyctochytrium arcticum]|nr:hypothetical protein DFS34DRAFT_674788 [Phlyctochytrium arcticum]